MSGEVYIATIWSRYVHGSHESLPIDSVCPGQRHDGDLRPSAMHDGPRAWHLVSGWFWPYYSDFPGLITFE